MTRFYALKGSKGLLLSHQLSNFVSARDVMSFDHLKKEQLSLTWQNNGGGFCGVYGQNVLEVY